MPSTVLSAAPQTYVALRTAVEAVVIKGRQDIDRAWLHSYHETGRLINEHFLRNKARADYGASVYIRLAEDTGISKRTLQECAQFHRYFPIARARAQLGWAHYRLLCQVDNAAQRQALTAETIKQHWTSRDLQERVRALNAIDVTPAKDESSAAPKLLTPKRGTPGVCKVIAGEDTPVVDLGFATYLDLPADTDLVPGDLVQLGRKVSALNSPLSALGPGFTKADLFTYSAAVLKVVDGDTLWVKVYLRPGHWVKQKLRLRDLDCPEMSTPAGQAAKRFVDDFIARTTDVTICTTKPDKYDRYLADVFLCVTSDVGPVTSAGSEIYLNNELLEAGHAVRMNEYSPSDWDDK